MLSCYGEARSSGEAYIQQRGYGRIRYGEPSMDMKILSARTTLRQSPQSDAAQPRQHAGPMTKAEQQQLRDQIRQTIQSVREGVAGADAQGGGQLAAVPPVPPIPPRMITVRGPNGQVTTIGVPGGFSARDVIPPQAVDISVAFFATIAIIIIGLPIARALARRMDRRGAGPAQIPGEVSAQLNQLNQAVDAIALEVERISRLSPTARMAIAIEAQIKRK